VVGPVDEEADGRSAEEAGKLMLSYIFDFNLNVVGEAADRYLTKAVQQWPALFEELPGVQGTLFLINAFTLAGRYTYSFRVDFESFTTLAAYDEALKSDDQRWREVKSDWFERRTEVRGRVLRGAGQSDLQSGKGLLHVVLGYQGGANGSGAAAGDQAARVSQELQNFEGVEHAQHFTTVFQPAGGDASEVWLRVAGIDTLDSVDAITSHANRLVAGQLTTSGLYGELRLVEGALLSGA
jgi:hypothetical protein